MCRDEHMRLRLMLDTPGANNMFYVRCYRLCYTVFGFVLPSNHVCRYCFKELVTWIAFTFIMISACVGCELLATCEVVCVFPFLKRSDQRQILHITLNC